MSIQLNNQSNYTFFKSAIRVEDLVEKAKQQHDTALALCDHGNLYQLPTFHKLCKQNGIKPIHGMEIDVFYNEQIIPMLLIAKDNDGLQSLFACASFLNDGTHSYCTIDDLNRFRFSCFLFIYGNCSYFNRMEDDSILMQKLAILKQDLQPFDLGLDQVHDRYDHEWNMRLKNACIEVGIQTVALPCNNAMKQSDDEMLRNLVAIEQNVTLKDLGRMHITSKPYLSKEEMQAMYTSDDLLRSDEIANEINVTLPPFKTSLPVYSNPKMQGVTPSIFLRTLSYQGLCLRLHVQSIHQIPDVYQKRLERELNLIIDKHLENYFLIVYDMIRYALTNDIPVGVGRGSAVGSLVCYVIGITHVDPVKYDLLFERFLNESRLTMPDIDIDIAKNRVDDVRSYIQHKYGIDHTARIIIFNTFAKRSAWEMAARLLGLNSPIFSFIKNLIDDKGGSLKEQFESNLEFRSKILTNQRSNTLDCFNLAKELEGYPRSIGVHEPGIIVSNDPIEWVVPTQVVPRLKEFDEKVFMTQFGKAYLEDFGLIKFDLLAQGPPMDMQLMERLIQKVNPSFKVKNIPLDDVRTYEHFCSEDVLEIPQCSTGSGKRVLRTLQPKCFEDLMAFMALNRPGPGSEAVKQYADCRDGKQQIYYLHPCLKEILEETNGVILYQEQVMKIAVVAANFSLTEADILRSVISKKNLKQMVRTKELFIKGCVANGFSVLKAEELFAQIEKFAGYGFNKSHACAYANVAYNMMYLKVNYPYQFYKIYLDRTMFNRDATYIKDALDHGVRIKNVDINHSSTSFEIVEDGLLAPFTSLEYWNDELSKKLMEERSKHPFTSFFDTMMRMKPYAISVNQWDSLIYAGAFDSFKQHRNELSYNVSSIDKYANIYYEAYLNHKERNLYDFKQTGMESLKEHIINESSVYGTYLDFDQFKLVKKMNQDLVDFNQITTIQQARMKQSRAYYFTICGVVIDVKTFEKYNKPNEHWAIVRIMDETGAKDIRISSNKYKQYEPYLHIGFIGFFKFNQGSYTEGWVEGIEELNIRY